MMQDDTGIDRDTKSTKQDKKVKNWNTTILIVLIIVLIALEYESDVPLYKAKYSEDNQLQKALEILK